jgi:hypothetical protein
MVIDRGQRLGDAAPTASEQMAVLDEIVDTAGI